jgi:hypothetical protein
LRAEFADSAIGNKAFNRRDHQRKAAEIAERECENPLNCFLCDLREFSAFSAVKSLFQDPRTALKTAVYPAGSGVEKQPHLW